MPKQSIPPHLLDRLAGKVTRTAILNAEQVRNVYEALDEAYREGSESDIDPMEGAIEALKERMVLGGASPEEDRMVALALNEAFRNGMRSEQEQHTCQEPSGVYVVIPGLPQNNVSGGVAQRDWFASRRSNEHVTTFQGGVYPVYQINGDPNSVAVGRFKASLRKFIGVD